MTRRDYRGHVAAPRPAAAWLMSLFAGATLWITELLPLWMVAIQLLAFAVSFATRDDPPAFRSSPIFLNIGMLGITAVTIRSALDGNPATISLAFFTCLAQGLQLLDARPRRSEFLLVTLALFQVILASSLTDSVFYPPLVLLFLASVTWTLLIHTLRMEAAETGDDNAASEVIRSDLRRMTIVATCGCMALALVLFLILPRVTTQMLRGGIPSGLAVSGFSDRIRLGEFGRIRKDHSIVLRVESLEGELPEPAEAYWRGLAFDEFDGRNWSVSAPAKTRQRHRSFRHHASVRLVGIQHRSADPARARRGRRTLRLRRRREDRRALPAPRARRQWWPLPSGTESSARPLQRLVASFATRRRNPATRPRPASAGARTGRPTPHHSLSVAPRTRPSHRSPGSADRRRRLE
jgi:hypothetical protein